MKRYSIAFLFQAPFAGWSSGHGGAIEGFSIFPFSNGLTFGYVLNEEIVASQPPPSTGIVRDSSRAGLVPRRSQDNHNRTNRASSHDDIAE